MSIHPILRLALTLSLAGACLGAVAAQPAADASPPATTPADAQFIRQAADDGMAEIQMAQVALDKTSNHNVQQFARQLLDDHRKANDVLHGLAHDRQLTLADELPASARKEAEELKNLAPGKFDAAWIKAMVKTHEQAVVLFRSESGSTRDADLGRFIDSNLPMLRAHLARAKKLQHELTLPNLRDKAMGKAGVTKSAFDHTRPAAASTTAAAMAPAPARSVGAQPQP